MDYNPRTQQWNVTSKGFIGIAEGFHVTVYAFSKAKTGSGFDFSTAKVHFIRPEKSQL